MDTGNWVLLLEALWFMSDRNAWAIPVVQTQRLEMRTHLHEKTGIYGVGLERSEHYAHCCLTKAILAIEEDLEQNKANHNHLAQGPSEIRPLALLFRVVFICPLFPVHARIVNANRVLEASSRTSKLLSASDPIGTCWSRFEDVWQSNHFGCRKLSSTTCQSCCEVFGDKVMRCGCGKVLKRGNNCKYWRTCEVNPPAKSIKDLIL